MPRRLLRLVLIVAVPFVLIAGGLVVWLMGGRYVSTENAYVKNDIVHVAAEVDGRVIEVPIRNHAAVAVGDVLFRIDPRSEEHTSELQSLMRISYAVFCLKKTKNKRRP